MTKTPSHPPFYFIVTFWGEKFSKLFLDVCLSSLLSPNNIPVLNEDRRSKFLIVTTKQDWENIKNTRKFRYLSNFIEPVFINIGPFSKCTSKMQLMSQGHKLASKVAFADDALGVFLTPDLILSDGSVLTLKKYAIDGKQAVLCAAVRFSWEDCKDTLQALTYDDEHNRIILSPRQLNHLVLDKLHSETRRYDWQSNFYCTYPISSFWKLPNDQGIVIHTYSWAPLLLNYPAIIEHNTETFDSWTLDGDYVYQNFRDLNLITTITNSDELMLASFTPEAELSFEFRKHWLLDGYFSNSAKMSSITPASLESGDRPTKKRIN